MRKSFFHIPALFLLCFSVPTLAQQSIRLTQENGDCTGAIPIPDSVYYQPSAVRGFGNKLEIKENPVDHTQWFEREHHTTWYKFRSPVTTKLTFDIIPDSVEDDIDFLVFEGAVPGICDKIASKQVQPIRSNISRNDKEMGSRCGLSADAPDQFVRSGIGASYSSAIEVKEGDLFYLVVDYQDRPLAGYTIHFHYDPAPPPVLVEDKTVQKQQLVINVMDAKSGKPVKANLTIDGMVFDKVIEGRGTSTYNYEMDMYRSLKIGCTSEGYMFTTVKVKGNMEPIVNVELKLTPIAPGEHVVLDDIRFVGNEDKVLRSSEASLLLLLRFMQDNPKVKIEVEGHVNGPTFKNKKEFIDLSTSRARSVYEFLMVNDIEVERISYVGFGNSRMLFPEPKTKEQSEANRRVEIKVLSN
ncbi:MAG: OmpA family protein [Flavobacteriales bacterium]|nr:OmpA family protein [Flavobacteriales bacterium]